MVPKYKNDGIAIVTGASQGLGLAFVQHLLSKDHHVHATTRKLDDIGFQHPQLTWHKLDLTRDEDISTLTLSIEKTSRPVDLVINNAGINKRGVSGGDGNTTSKMGFLKRSSMLEIFDVNVIAPVILTQAIIKQMNTLGSFIVNISSSRASFEDEFSNDSANYGYRASKAALNMVTHSAIVDLPVWVHTFSVHPGSICSRMNPNGKDTPEAQAKKIMAIVESWDGSKNGMFLRYTGKRYGKF